MYQRTALEEIVAKFLQDMGVEFVEQYPTRSGFVLDFVVSPNIAIEVDGPCHDGSKTKRRDRFRDNILKTEGWVVHRLSYQVINDAANLTEVLDKITHKSEA